VIVGAKTRGEVPARRGATPRVCGGLGGSGSQRRRAVDGTEGRRVDRGEDGQKDPPAAGLGLPQAPGLLPEEPQAPPPQGGPRGAGGLQKNFAGEVGVVREAHPYFAEVEAWAQDEHRLGLKPVLRRVWTRRGERPLAPVHLTATSGSTSTASSGPPPEKASGWYCLHCLRSTKSSCR
jgi:hypothetical protein